MAFRPVPQAQLDAAVSACEAGMTAPASAAAHGISQRTLERYRNRSRGSPEAKAARDAAKAAPRSPRPKASPVVPFSAAILSSAPALSLATEIGRLAALDSTLSALRARPITPESAKAIDLLVKSAARLYPGDPVDREAEAVIPSGGNTPCPRCGKSSGADHQATCGR